MWVIRYLPWISMVVGGKEPVRLLTNRLAKKLRSHRVHSLNWSKIKEVSSQSPFDTGSIEGHVSYAQQLVSHQQTHIIIQKDAIPEREPLKHRPLPIVVESSASRSAAVRLLRWKPHTWSSMISAGAVLKMVSKVDLGFGAVVYITYTDVGSIGLWNIHTEFWL